MKGYSVARLSKDNLIDLARLHSEVYGKAVADDYIFRKYATAFTDVENVGFIAYDSDDRPVAYYGVIPCFIQLKNKIVLAAQSADTMTHPKHRRKGLFITLSNMTFDLCQQLGITLIFGFPNQNSYPTMIHHLGWIETGKMSRFSIPVNTYWRNNFFQKKERSQDAVLEKLLSPGQHLPNSVFEDGFGGVYRDEGYYHYKSFTKTCVIRIGSTDAWIKIGKELIIGDIMLTPKTNEDFFEEMKSLAEQLHLNKITFQVCAGCRLHDLFADRFMAIPSFPVLFKEFGAGLELNKIKFTFADIDIF